MPTQPSFNSFTRSKAGVRVRLVRCWLPAVQARGRLWVPAFACVTEKGAGAKRRIRSTKPRAGACGRLTDWAGTVTR